jgi:hypothetical protein
MASGPVEIPDTEDELVIERVAVIDVAKAAGKVCVRCPARRAAGLAGCGDARRHDLRNLLCPMCPCVGQPLGIHGHGLPKLCRCRCLCFAKRLQHHAHNLLYLGLNEHGQVVTRKTVHCQHALVEVAPAQRF